MTGGIGSGMTAVNSNGIAGPNGKGMGQQYLEHINIEATVFSGLV
jgi:hypothetical protein